MAIAILYCLYYELKVRSDPDWEENPFKNWKKKSI